MSELTDQEKQDLNALVDDLKGHAAKCIDEIGLLAESCAKADARLKAMAQTKDAAAMFTEILAANHKLPWYVVMVAPFVLRRILKQKKAA